jgi:hypothetical protein
LIFGVEPPSNGLSDFQLATGRKDLQPPTHKAASAPGGDFSGSMIVTISHEYFTEGVVLLWEGQSTEELSHVEALQWFKVHGAKLEVAVNEAINCAINLGRADITIKNPIRDFPQTDPTIPRL